MAILSHEYPGLLASRRHAVRPDLESFPCVTRRHAAQDGCRVTRPGEAAPNSGRQRVKADVRETKCPACSGAMRQAAVVRLAERLVRRLRRSPALCVTAA